MEMELSKDPLIIPADHDTILNVTTNMGFIELCGKSYFVKLCVPTNINDASLECEWELQRLLSSKLEPINERLKKAKSLSEFWNDFKFIAENCIGHESIDLDILSQKYETILEQIEEVDNAKLISIDADFRNMKFELCDLGGRVHNIDIAFDKQSHTPVCSTDMPMDFDFHWSSKCKLKHLIEQFESIIDSYQEFWNMLRDIDEKCWVLEPETSSNFSSTQRRIALGPNLSLHISVNCLQPKTLPECRFFGADSATNPLKERLNINLHLWDVDRSLLNNLQEVLCMDFPTQATSSPSNLTVDCGICYCLHLDDEIPDIICEEKRCAQAFHRACLYEWLRNLASRQSFDTIFGECPFCCHPIKVKKHG